MASLGNDIHAFDRMRPDLERRHAGEWALFQGGQLVDVYPDFEAAATVAEARFIDVDYLIRQIGVEAVQLSGGMIFRPKHVLDSRGL